MGRKATDLNVTLIKMAGLPEKFFSCKAGFLKSAFFIACASGIKEVGNLEEAL
jgi:hypothetical protein